MRTTEIPSNNMGGLRKIIAIRADAFNGLSFLTFNKFELNELDPEKCIKILCLSEDAGFQENRKESDSGMVYQVDISGIIYGDSSINDEIISELDAGSWVVAAKNAQGIWRVGGANRVKMVFERKKQTTTTPSGLCGTPFSFSCEDEFSCPEINPLPSF